MTYFGGKAQDGVYQTIINQIPIHDRYIEPFLGGGAIMLKKRLAKINMGMEKDSGTAKAFLHPEACKVDIFNSCGIKYLRSLIGEKTSDGQKTFIYCDPPYPLSTRGKTRYKFDFTTANHVEFLTIIKQLSFETAVSTYPNDLYSEILSGWRLLEYNSTDRSGTVRTEHLYMNYPEPIFLHDDQYLGDNANNRQDIKRRIQRTKNRLLGWEPRERIKLMKQLLINLSPDEKKFILDE
jgi:hypothetical protein